MAAATPEERAAASAARRAAAVAAGVIFDDQAAFRAWLEEHAATAEDIWLRTAKKSSTRRTVVHREALDEALCFGWIDAQSYSDDHPDFTLRRFVPRRPRSTWSQINRERVAELTAEGKMTPQGQAEIDRAVADGRMAAAYQPASSKEMPPELAAALKAAGPAAEAAFAALKSAERYSMVHRIAVAKKAETKVRNAEAFAAQLLASAAPGAPAGA